MQLPARTHTWAYNKRMGWQTADYVQIRLNDFVAKPPTVRRATWGAKPPVLSLPAHHVTKITVHHTGVAQDSKRDFFDKLRGLQSWSQRDDFLSGGKPKPKWADIPYHYYIDWKGTIAECRPIALPGDTNTSYDTTGHALIVVEGLFPKDEFNSGQQRSLERLVQWLAWHHSVPHTQVKGHMDFAPKETDCPGESVYRFLPRLRRLVALNEPQW